MGLLTLLKTFPNGHAVLVPHRILVEKGRDVDSVILILTSYHRCFFSNVSTSITQRSVNVVLRTLNQTLVLLLQRCFDLARVTTSDQCRVWVLISKKSMKTLYRGRLESTDTGLSCKVVRYVEVPLKYLTNQARKKICQKYYSYDVMIYNNT